MEHVGIDLGKNHSHVVVVTQHGEIVRERVVTHSLPGWLKSRSRSRVVMEACTQSHAVATAALASGHEAIVVPTAVVRALGVGARGIKTDERDAEALANASLRNLMLPSSHLRSRESKERLGIVSARDILLRGRRDTSLHIKSWLRGNLISVKGRANVPEFVASVRRAAKAEGIEVPFSIEQLFVTFLHLCEQIAVFDAEIERFTKADPVCQRLMRMPGVGPMIAYAFTACIDDPLRFASADQLASYLALVPGEATTGGKLKRTGTISAGPTWLKALLVQGMWSMWRSVPNDPIVVWGRAIADKRGARIAVVAMARKTATILWSMWKHGTTYDPLRASAARYAPPPTESAQTQVTSKRKTPKAKPAAQRPAAPPTAASSPSRRSKKNAPPSA